MTDTRMTDDTRMEDIFFDELRNGGGVAVPYLKQQGGSLRWINSLIDKCMNCSQQEIDWMKADLASHFKNVQQKRARGIGKGMLWSRMAPKNLTNQLTSCKKCMDDREKGAMYVEHVLDMHPELCLYIGNGTDKHFNQENLTFKVKKA